MKATSEPKGETWHPDAQELALLRILSEQDVVPLDQLARFLRSTPAQTEALLETLHARGCVRLMRVTPNPCRWVWLSRRGAKLIGLRRAPRGDRPRQATLHRFRAINEVRLHLENREPKGRWLSRSSLEDRAPTDSLLPDALFEVGGERHAIAVELSARSQREYRGLLAASKRYEAMLCFCHPSAAALLRRIAAERPCPNLAIRPLPAGARLAPAPRQAPERALSPQERTALRLISEQGTVRFDQLARFLSLRELDTEQFVESLCESNLATRHDFLAGEPEWVVLTHAGARLAETSLARFSPSPRTLKRWLVLNELRLYFATRSPSARWLNHRSLAKVHGRAARTPEAELRYDGKRIAINVRQNAYNKDTIVPRAEAQSETYDAVVFYCLTPKGRVYLRHLQESFRWSKVVVRDMPSVTASPPVRRTAEKLVDSLLTPH